MEKAARHTTMVWITALILIATNGCSTPRQAFPTITAPPDQIVAGHLYDELAAAIDDGKIDAIINFAPGRVSVGGATLVVRPETKAHVEASITSGRIRKAALLFSLPVLIETDDPRMTLSFSRVDFDRFGRSMVADLRVDGPPIYQLFSKAVVAQAGARIEAALPLNVFAKGLLRGDVFISPDDLGQAALPNPISTMRQHTFVSLAVFSPDDSETTAPVGTLQSLIETITIRVDDASLAHGAKLQLSSYEEHPDFGPQSRIFVGDDSHIDLPYVHLDFDRASGAAVAIDVIGANLYLNTVESVLVTAAQTFKLGRNSTMLLRGLDFRASREHGASAWDWSFESQGGVADVEIAYGGLGLDGMYLQVGEGSSMTLREVRFRGSAGELLELRGQGALRLKVDGGVVSLGPLLFQVAEHSVLELDGVVSSSQSTADSPGLQIAGEVSLLDLRIADLTLSEDILHFLESIGADPNQLNLVPLGSAATAQVAYVRAGPDSRLMTRGLSFNNNDEWNVDGAIELLDLRGVQGRLRLGPDSSVDFGENSRVMLTDVQIDQSRRSVSGALGAHINVTGGSLALGRGNFATRFPLSAPSRVLIEPGAMVFGESEGGVLHGEIAEIVIATPPAANEGAAVLRLGNSVAIAGVERLVRSEPTELVLAGGAAIRVSGLQVDSRGPSSAAIEVDGTVTEARLRIDEHNGLVVDRPFAFRSVTPLRFSRSDEAGLSGRIEGSGIQMSAGTLAPGGSTRMTQLQGEFDSVKLDFLDQGRIRGELRGGTLRFSGGRWALGPAKISLTSGSADGCSIMWLGPGDGRTRLFARSIEAGLTAGPVNRRRVADGIVITAEPIVEGLSLETVDAAFSGARSLDSITIESLSLKQNPDASVLIEVDTQESRVFYKTTDDDGNPLDQPVTQFRYNQHGIMGVRVWLTDAQPLRGGFAWSNGTFTDLPKLPEQTLRVAFDSRNDHYDTGNKGASRVTLSGNTVPVDGNTKDKVHGQRERATRRVIVASGRESDADYRVFIWNTAGAKHGFDPPASRPANRPNPPSDLLIPLEAGLAIESDGVYLSLVNFGWPKLEEGVHYDVWIDVDDWAEFFGGIASVATSVFTLGQAEFDPVGKGIRAGRRDADKRLNAGFGEMVDSIFDYFDSNPIIVAD